ncbi:MAG: hypothetical protein Harvfovirus40_1, partial [Harvfovirus sp.]
MVIIFISSSKCGVTLTALSGNTILTQSVRGGARCKYSVQAGVMYTVNICGVPSGSFTADQCGNIMVAPNNGNQITQSGNTIFIAGGATSMMDPPAMPVYTPLVPSMMIQPPLAPMITYPPAPAMATPAPAPAPTPAAGAPAAGAPGTNSVTEGAQNPPVTGNENTVTNDNNGNGNG